MNLKYKQCIDNNVTPGFPCNIGGVTVNNPIWLAPLAGITFSSLRRFYKQQGVGLVHTEMVSALGLQYKGQKTQELLFADESENPIVLQLFGANADDIGRGAEIALETRRYAAIQINMACPMPKVTRKGSGSALLDQPEEAGRIMKVLKQFGLPVWSKIRVLPADKSTSKSDTAFFCDKLLSSGCDYILVHGRTKAQRYEGVADKEIVGEMASLFPKHIGGSGDCFKPEDFIEYLNRGCTSVLAARGILRDIFIIPKTLQALGADISDSSISPNVREQSDMIISLGDMITENEGEMLAVVIAKRMLVSLFKGFHGAAQIRRQGCMLRTWQEMRLLIDSCEEYLNDCDI